MARRQSTSTETSTRSGSNDVLCWCDKGVSHRDFVEFTLQNPEMEFGNLCEKIGVGQRCTSCLLNAEETYVKARQGEVQILAESDKIILKSAQSQVKKTAKHKFYDRVDSIFPNIPRSRTEIMPIIAGNKISTELRISNSEPPILMGRAASFVVNIQCYCREGVCFKQKSYQLRPNDHIAVNVSDDLPTNGDPGHLQTGSCWIEMKPLDDGYIGFTRPHFLIRSQRGTSSLHTQFVSSQHSIFNSARINRRECQFISYVNAEDRPVKVSFTVRPLNSAFQEAESSCTLVPYGAKVMPIPELLNLTESYYRRIECWADGATRRHLIISDTDFDQVSIDHL